MTTKTTEGTAYHEAGHAVLAHRYELHYDYVTIVPDPEQGSAGHCSPVHFPDDFHPDVSLSAEEEVWLRKYLEMTLAGDAAVTRLRGRHNWRGAAADYHEALHDAVYLTSTDEDEEALALLKWLQVRVKFTMQTERVWAQVEALAAALLARDTLTEDEVEAVLLQARREHFTRVTGKVLPEGLLVTAAPEEE